MVMIGGHTLIDHTIGRMTGQTDGLVICGRSWPGIPSLADRPAPDLGPLGGLSASLHHAHKAGFEAVLCAPIDVHPLPENLRQLLEGPGPKTFALQYAVGFWPVRYKGCLDRHLAGGNLSFRSWIESSGAIAVPDEILALENVNTPDDLDKLMQRRSA